MNTCRTPIVAFASACLFAVIPSAKGQAAHHWSLRALVRPEVPAVRDTKWARNPIDAFVLARLEQGTLSPSPEADRRTLIRRVCFDLTGLPPSPEEVESFVSDPSPDAYEKLVDRLLASPRYGERWARHWLDVVRFADSHGFEMNQPRPNAWHYRDYVIRSLNQDKPYDRFVLEQLAGDAIGADEATGFLVAGPWDQVKSPDPVLTAQQRADELHDLVSVTSAAFLGLTVGCARCHDHKFDPVSQADYFRTVAVFSGVQHGERPLRRGDEDARAAQAATVRRELEVLEVKLDALQPLALPGKTGSRLPVSPVRNVERFEPVEAKFVRFTVSGTNQFEPCIDELEVYAAGDTTRNVALAAAGARPTSSGDYPGNDIHKLEHVNDGRYGNGRSWICKDATGWVQLELAEKTRIDRIVWGRDREGKFRDRLATAYRIEVSADGAAWRPAASSDDRIAYDPTGKQPVPASDTEGLKPLLEEKQSIEKKLIELTSQRLAYTGTFVQPGPTLLHHRGDPMQPKGAVAPGALASVGPKLDLPPDAPEQQRRLVLAKWVVDPSNPLTARVIVNRLWQHHFGRGIVATPSDFGRMGAAPTHPELLDWLAAELVQGPVPSERSESKGWRLKPIHRLIVTSAAYRQGSASRPDALAVDAGSTLLWRYPPRRIEAEAIRDAILAVSGMLDLTAGGPGFDVFKPNDNYVRVYDPKDQFGPAEFRRMVYQFKPRLQHDGTFGAFDCPDAGQSTPARASSTTPLQALNLMNGPFVVQQAEFFAERVRKEAGEGPAAQVNRAFGLAFGRTPEETERAAGVQLVRHHGLPALCRALFNANEFVYVN
jgi:hypothetical protein